jgi:uncharacterized protein YrrD
VKRIEELLGMPVVTVQEGTRLGAVKGVEIDAAEGWIRYLRFDGAGHRADGVIPWDAVRSVGADALTIDSVSQVQETVGSAAREALTGHVGDRPVVTEDGRRLGTIRSYDIDERTGRITAYHLTCGGFLGGLLGKDLVFPHEAVRAFGKDAIVVSDAVVPAKQREEAA